MFTRAESVEQLFDLGSRLPRTRRKSCNNCQKAAAGQRLQLEVCNRSNRGRPWQPAK